MPVTDVSTTCLVIYLQSQSELYHVICWYYTLVIDLSHLSLKMTTAPVVETSVIVNNNSPIQDYVLPDDQTQPRPTFKMNPGLKPFTV